MDGGEIGARTTRLERDVSQLLADQRAQRERVAALDRAAADAGRRAERSTDELKELIHRLEDRMREQQTRERNTRLTVFLAVVVPPLLLVVERVYLGA